MAYGLQPAQRLVFQQASEKLDNYIVVRGTIAYRLNHGETVYKDWGTIYLSQVERLA